MGLASSFEKNSPNEGCICNSEGSAFGWPPDAANASTAARPEITRSEKIRTFHLIVYGAGDRHIPVALDKVLSGNLVCGLNVFEPILRIFRFHQIWRIPVCPMVKRTRPESVAGGFDKTPVGRSDAEIEQASSEVL
jgi:hypothetical protein